MTNLLAIGPRTTPPSSRIRGFGSADVTPCLIVKAQEICGRGAHRGFVAAEAGQMRVAPSRQSAISHASSCSRCRSTAAMAVSPGFKIASSIDLRVNPRGGRAGKPEGRIEGEEGLHRFRLISEQKQRRRNRGRGQPGLWRAGGGGREALAFSPWWMRRADSAQVPRVEGTMRNQSERATGSRVEQKRVEVGPVGSLVVGSFIKHRPSHAPSLSRSGQVSCRWGSQLGQPRILLCCAVSGCPQLQRPLTSHPTSPHLPFPPLSPLPAFHLLRPLTTTPPTAPPHHTTPTTTTTTHPPPSDGTWMHRPSGRGSIPQRPSDLAADWTASCGAERAHAANTQRLAHTAHPHRSNVQQLARGHLQPSALDRPQRCCNAPCNPPSSPPPPGGGPVRPLCVSGFGKLLRRRHPKKTHEKNLAIPSAIAPQTAPACNSRAPRHRRPWLPLGGALRLFPPTGSISSPSCPPAHQCYPANHSPDSALKTTPQTRVAMWLHSPT